MLGSVLPDRLNHVRTSVSASASCGVQGGGLGEFRLRAGCRFDLGVMKLSFNKSRFLVLSVLTVGTLSLTQCVVPVNNGYRGRDHDNHDNHNHGGHYQKPKHNDHDDHDHDRDNHNKGSYNNSKWKKGSSGYGNSYNNGSNANWNGPGQGYGQGGSVGVYGGGYRN